MYSDLQTTAWLETQSLRQYSYQVHHEHALSCSMYIDSSTCNSINYIHKHLSYIALAHVICSISRWHYITQAPVIYSQITCHIKHKHLSYIAQAVSSTCHMYTYPVLIAMCLHLYIPCIDSYVCIHTQY